VPSQLLATARVAHVRMIAHRLIESAASLSGPLILAMVTMVGGAVSDRSMDPDLQMLRPVTAGSEPQRSGP
jgi:hypothetical protein